MEMAGGVELDSSEPLVCIVCKCPYVDVGRALCASCLTRSLQRACKSSAALSPGTPPIRRVSPRAFFPGMPRAVLSASEGGVARIVKRRSSKIELHRSSATAREKITILSDGKVPACQLSSRVVSPSAANTSKTCEVDTVKENHDVVHVIGISCPSSRYEDGNGKIQNSVGAVLPRKEDGTPVMEKWQLFQVQKNLTVRIPNPATDMPNLQCPQVQKHVTVKVSNPASDIPNYQRPQSLPLVQTKRNHHSAQPLQKRALPKSSRQSKPRGWTIVPDADAEADLMMRLLADTMPILKSTAPLVLPPCEIKPPPSLSPSPPGDPLWKRRCIPCPKSLELHTLSICVI